MKRVKIFTSSSGEACWHKDILDKIKMKDDSYEIVDNNYTHAIVINNAMPKLNIEKSKVIGLAWEPLNFLGITKEYMEWAENNVGKYLIGDKINGMSDIFVENLGYLIHEKINNNLKEKTKIMSIIVSQKSHNFYKNRAQGYQYRDLLCKSIIKFDLPIDIYGRGCNLYGESENIKGEFKNYEPYNGYKFHICIENFRSNHYISEKLVNPLICGVTPLYLGCRNVDKYYKNVIKMTGNLVEDLKLIRKICQNPEKYIKDVDIKEVENVSSIKNVINMF
jgi:hypothetical protein